MAKQKKIEELTQYERKSLITHNTRLGSKQLATDIITRCIQNGWPIPYGEENACTISYAFDQTNNIELKELKILLKLIWKHQVITEHTLNISSTYIHNYTYIFDAYKNSQYTPQHPERAQELKDLVSTFDTVKKEVLQQIHDLAVATAQVIVQLVKEANRERQAPGELETHRTATEATLAIAREKAHILGIEETIFNRPIDISALDYALTLLRTNHLPANFHTVPKEVTPTRLSLTTYLVKEIKDTQKSSNPEVTDKYKELLELALEKDRQADKNTEKNPTETILLSKQDGIAALKRPGSTHSDESGYGGSPRTQRKDGQTWAEWLGLEGVRASIANMVTGNTFSGDGKTHRE